MSHTGDDPPRESGIRALIALCFGLSRPVARRDYAVCGFALTALKYGIDTLIVYGLSGRVWMPFDYLQPVFSARAPDLDLTAQWPLIALAAWSLPFLWIGVSMSMRRALDAGISPWFGCAFFVPLVNYLMMLLLCVLPSATRPPESSRLARAGEADWRHFVASAAAGAGLGLAMTVFSVFVLHMYGGGLFLGTPFCMGCLTAYLYNREGEQSVARTMSAVQLSLLLMGGSLILFALEGVVCIVMAYPLAVFLAALGGVLGQTLATASRSSAAPTALLLLALPILTGAESVRLVAPQREAATSVEIDAPPEAVWPNVIGFSDLPPPSELVFRLGIAYPRSARIEGRGVGAVRHCEFSTGAFIEPITHWEEPTRLSFDVVSQPHPMHEWSPYESVNAPHLAGGMRSKRGEFRLVRLPHGRTRLEGSTWYELDMFPQAYWTLWSDALVHRIHSRVLAHIKRLSERPGSS